MSQAQFVLGEKLIRTYQTAQRWRKACYWVIGGAVLLIATAIHALMKNPALPEWAFLGLLACGVPTLVAAILAEAEFRGVEFSCKRHEPATVLSDIVDELRADLKAAKFLTRKDAGKP